MSQRTTDLVLLYGGGSSTSDKGVAYPVVLRNRGAGHFWDVELRALHDGEETDRKTVRQVGPQSESEQVYLLIPAKFCDKGSPGVGLRPQGHAAAEALLGGEVVVAVDLPGGTESPRVERVPRTPEERATLLQGRQDGWEYLLFAAALLRERNALEPKYRDHEIGFAKPQPGPRLDVHEGVTLTSAATHEAGALVENVERIFSPAAQVVAFGAPGEPGDPEAIEHLASRVIDVYEGLLDWAARIRGTSFDDDFKTVAELVGHFVDLPIRQFREFVDKVVSECDRLPAFLASDGDETLHLTLELKVEMDPDVLDRFTAEMRQLEMRYGIDQ